MNHARSLINLQTNKTLNSLNGVLSLTNKFIVKTEIDNFLQLFLYLKLKFKLSNSVLNKVYL